MVLGCDFRYVVWFDMCVCEMCVCLDLFVLC